MKRILLAALCIFISTSVLSAQSATNSTTTIKVEDLMQHSFKNGLFNGVVLVTENGKPIYKAAFGDADIGAKKQLNTETAFYLASVSKQFTTMAIMILKEQGKLAYNDALSKYYPEFPRYSNNVTIKHLMNHTSGIPNHYSLGAYKVGLTNKDVLELLIKQEQLDFDPGEKYSYSNGGYVLLALIAEKASGMPFHKFMKQYVFDPLGMDRTLVYDESSPSIENRAVGYNASGALDDYEIFTTGAGGMFSTIGDLHLWDQALYTEKLISKSTLEEAFTVTTLNNGEISNYGYGWGIRDVDGKKTVLHTGSLSGYRTILRRNLYNNSGYIMLTNKGSSFATSDITGALNNILSGESYNLPKIPISTKLSRVLAKEDDVTKAIEKVKHLLKTQEDNYKTDENAINSLGYDYLQNDDIQTALAVFQLNVELFPNASNVYDSLAEAQLVDGDTLQSIANYKKSYQLNRNNDNAISVLKRIGVDVSDLVTTVEVPEAVLESYVGDYALSPTFILTIKKEGSKLLIHPTGQNVSEIFPSSETRFYSKIVNAQITFNKDESGKVVSLTLHQNGDQLAVKQ